MRTTAPGALRSVEVWLNVFIPFDVPGPTVPVRRGPHAGKWALDIGSSVLLTDQRSFSRDPRAASRMHSRVAVDLAVDEPVVTIRHRGDWAITCDRDTGEVVCRSRPRLERMTARVASRTPVGVSLDCATTCPCPGAPPALDRLEYRGTIRYDPAGPVLSVDLMVGLFPAIEGYASVNGGAGVVMFHQAPLPIAGSAAVGARRRIRTAFARGDGSGFFESA